MDRANKAKFVVFGVIALLFLVIILAFVIASKKRGGKEPSETVVHSQVESKFTLEDMMKVNGKNQPVQPRNAYENKGLQPDDNVYQEDEDAIRLQNKIQEHRQKEDSAVVQYRKQLMKTVQDIQGDDKQQPAKRVLPETIPDRMDVPGPELVIESEPELPVKKSRFFKPTDTGKTLKNTVIATVHGEQILSNGTTLKMRLLENVETKDGLIIPKGSYIYGLVRLTGERMNVEIKSAQIEQLICPLKMKVYDSDGLSGIKVPTNLKYELATELTEAGLNEARVTGSSGSIVDKGLNVVTSAGSRVFRKQNRVVKIKIKSNYKLYLKKDEA